MKTYANFPALLQAFFIDRLMRQQQASPETIASYRDAFCLLFRFVRQSLNKAPSALTMEKLDAPLIVDFLCWLESVRGNSPRTRNARLAAIHSFFEYAALHDPTHIGLIQRVLAIPGKRYVRRPVEYLTRPETEALLAAPAQTTWGGRRDRALLLLIVYTGLVCRKWSDLTVKTLCLAMEPTCAAKERDVKNAVHRSAKSLSESFALGFMNVTVGLQILFFQMHEGAV